VDFRAQDQRGVVQVAALFYGFPADQKKRRSYT
jgi:hypothetical protein